MINSIEALERVCRLARQYGLKRMNVSGLELEFHTEKPNQQSQDAGIRIEGLKPERQLTEDELLFWSTPEGVNVEAGPPPSEQ